MALAYMAETVTTLVVPLGISLATVAVNSAVQAAAGGLVLVWLLRWPRIAGGTRGSATQALHGPQSQL